VPSPRPSRPYMPGYGTRPAEEGTGLLPWSWARERLERSHDYWVATVRPDGRPHLMPVWGAWVEERLWFSSSLGSRKTRNLAVTPDCAIATDDANEPVIIEGKAERLTDPVAIQVFVDAINRKYGTDYSIDFFSPQTNACFRVTPSWAFALTEADFTGSPTRWIFDSPAS
jgi:Pyridoxamine 5'-phosphate oxidase